LLQAIAEIKLPEELPYSKSVYHLCVLRVQDRDALQRELTQAGIGHRGALSHAHAPAKSLHIAGYAQGDLLAAERAAAEILSLPMYPQLTFEQLDEVVKVLQCHFQRSARSEVV